MTETIAHTPEETIALGIKFGKELPEGAIVCLFGDLGAGKTTFIKGLAAGAGVVEADEVHSPTFVFLNIYEGKRPVFHFDLYRLKGEEEFLGLGFDEYLYAGGIACIEWSERIEAIIPKEAIRVEITHRGETMREIKITGRNGKI